MDQIGRYEILDELGRGAMGIVYRARDTKIGREVAIKTIKFSDHADGSEANKLRERLFREAQSAGRLSHPGIVTIYDVAEEAGLAYITMEFVEGETLQALMETGRAKEPEFLAEILRQTAAALDYAHSREIVHRDIKPANIMVTGTGTVKITDFGIARISSSTLTQTGTVMGTPSYMSPEQVRGDEIDGRSDQFSLGVITYELLTEEKPFSGDSLTAVMFKIVSGDVQPPRELNEKISSDLEQAVMRALAKTGAERFPTCADFAEAVCAGLQSSGEAVLTPVARKEPAPAATIVEPPPQSEETASGPAPDELETVVKAADQTAPTVVAPALPPLDTQQQEELVAEEEPEEEPRRKGLWVAVAAMAGLLVAGAAYWLSPRADSLSLPGTEVAGTDTLGSEEPAGASQPDTPSGAGVTGSPADASGTEAGSGEESAAGGGESGTGGKESATGSAAPPETTQTAESRPPRVEPPPSRPPPAPETKATPKPKPPPAPRTVEVNFGSNQQGVRVVVDRNPQWSCTTPCSLELPRGEHTAVASLSGFHRVRRGFRVGSEPVDLAFELEAVAGTLLVSSSPSGADIYVDGKKMESQTNTSLRLPPGYHLIKVEKAGAGMAEQSVLVEEGQLRAVQFVLSSAPRRSTLNINTTPPGAQIIINDRRRSWVTPEELELAPGAYRISLSLAGHRPIIKEIQLEPGQTLNLEETLSPRN